MKFLTVSTALLLIAACAPSTPQPTELEGAKARWNARGFGDYKMHYQLFCFCPRETVQPSSVEVRGGVVTKVTILETQEVLDPRFYAAFLPVDALLTQLDKDLPLDPNSIFQNIEAIFDPTLGFPSKIVYTEKPIVADASRSYALSDVTALK